MHVNSGLCIEIRHPMHWLSCSYFGVSFCASMELNLVEAMMCKDAKPTNASLWKETFAETFHCLRYFCCRLLSIVPFFSVTCKERKRRRWSNCGIPRPYVLFPSSSRKYQYHCPGTHEIHKCITCIVLNLDSGCRCAMPAVHLFTLSYSCVCWPTTVKLNL